MKKIVLLFFATVMLINVFTVNASAALDTRSITLARTPVNKLIRGIINCFTFFLEIPASICNVSRKKGLLLGSTLGFADGVVTSIVRLGTGTFDTATFLIPPYDKPLLKPEYAIESLKEKSHDFE